eukprot:TRINITY_DN5959_c0_g1_i1.p1 TRINITY_DN5959_c0_g1~~TRINITY_DN5959_c0_g1_i1.p1  ORF type:complete len:1030 (-),score=219.04 TRINITY_DN5959_c0_g1_i1:11-3100(-)
MTVPEFHSPQPHATYLRQAIHYYMTRFVCGDGNVALGEECDGGPFCTACKCNPGYQPFSPTQAGCTESNECTLYGYSGNSLNTASCVQTVNGRVVTCKPGFFAVGAYQSNSITLVGDTPFLGCKDIDECLLYGYSDSPSGAATCLNQENSRVITCQPGYYAAPPSIVSITLTGNETFRGCHDIDECSVYGYSGKSNALKCEDNINSRTITCKPGFFVSGTSNLFSVVLEADAAFTGCEALDECALYGYSGKTSNVLRCVDGDNSRTITCALYGYSGKTSNVLRCVDGDNSRTITCASDFFVSGGQGLSNTITLKGSTIFSGCISRSLCAEYGYSGLPDFTMQCLAESTSRTVSCLPGYYAVPPATSSILLLESESFTGCVEINECELYGYSGRREHAIKCEDGINERRITCANGYGEYGRANSVSITLIGTSAFGGCGELNECDVYGAAPYSRTVDLIDRCEDQVQSRTVYCKSGYAAIGAPGFSSNITLFGPSYFSGCSDIDECLAYGFSGKANNTLSCVQSALNKRTITCKPGYYATAPATASITLTGAAPFKGCNPIDTCAVYGYKIPTGLANITCVVGANNTRIITCPVGYYATAPNIRSVTLTGDKEFSGCMDIPECEIFGVNNKTAHLATCSEITPDWRRVTCRKGYRVADHPVSDGSKNPSDRARSSYVDLYQNQQFFGCVLWCGDGIITGSETCDDGNFASGDGCSADCKSVESGFFCSKKHTGKACCKSLPGNVTEELNLDCYDTWWVSVFDNSTIDFGNGVWDLGPEAKICGNVILGEEESEDDYVVSDGEIRERLNHDNTTQLNVYDSMILAGSLQIKDTGALVFGAEGSLTIKKSCAGKIFPLSSLTKYTQLIVSHNGLIAVENITWSGEENATVPAPRIFMQDTCANINGVFFVSASEIPSGSNAFTLLESILYDRTKPCIHVPPQAEDEDVSTPFHHKDHIIPGSCSNIGSTEVKNLTRLEVTLNHKSLCVGDIVGISFGVTIGVVLVGLGVAVAATGVLSLPSGEEDSNGYVAV